MAAVDHEKLYEMALEAARELSTAPYSSIAVGAVARLSTGEIVRGANHENCSYPVGICAERSLLCSLQNQFAGQRVVAISVGALKDGKIFEISPCGMCRQSLLEFQLMQNSPISISFRYEGCLVIEPTLENLLPYPFKL